MSNAFISDIDIHYYIRYSIIMYTISKIVKKMRHTLIMQQSKTILGNISFFNENQSTTISNLYVNPNYRNYGFGKELLKQGELYSISEKITKNSLIKSNNKHYFKLCAWEPMDAPHIVKFYQNCGYEIDPHAITRYYDDQDRIYELINMTKEVNLNKQCSSNTKHIETVRCKQTSIATHNNL